MIQRFQKSPTVITETLPTTFMCCVNNVPCPQLWNEGDEYEGPRRTSSKEMYDKPSGCLLLPSDFAPSGYTVIIGRGKEAKQNLGNRRLRVLATPYVSRYSSARANRRTKTQIVRTVFESIRSAGGIFVKHEKNGQWIQVEDSVAREKIGYVFRDLLSDQYRSSSKSKVDRRYRELRASSPPLEEPVVPHTGSFPSETFLGEPSMVLSLDSTSISERTMQQPWRDDDMSIEELLNSPILEEY